MILLVTSDEGLRRRLMRALGADDDIAHCDLTSAIAHATDPAVSVAVVDWRTNGDAQTEMMKHRLRSRFGARFIGISPIEVVNRTRIITSTGIQVLDAIVPGTDAVAEVLRAHVNDPTKTLAAASSLELLLRLLPTSTHETLSAVIGSGFRLSTVKQLAAYYHKDRSSIAKTLKAVSHWTRTDLIDLAKGTYAVILLADVGLTPAAVSKAVGFAKEASLGDLLVRSVGAKWPTIKDRVRAFGAIAWLERQIGKRVAAARSRARIRSRGPPPSPPN